jgi:phosphomannomutase
MRGAITAETSDGCAAQPKSKVQKTWTLPETTARHGRLVLRTSGTEPVIRVMGEANDRPLVDSLLGDVSDAVAQAA